MVYKIRGLIWYCDYMYVNSVLYELKFKFFECGYLWGGRDLFIFFMNGYVYLVFRLNVCFMFDWCEGRVVLFLNLWMRFG